VNCQVVLAKRTKPDKGNVSGRPEELRFNLA
jgi:hypothetical protein